MRLRAVVVAAGQLGVAEVIEGQADQPGGVLAPCELQSFAQLVSEAIWGGVTVASTEPGADAPAELADRADIVLAGPAAVVGFLTDLAAAIGDV